MKTRKYPNVLIKTENPQDARRLLIVLLALTGGQIHAGDITVDQFVDRYAASHPLIGLDGTYTDDGKPVFAGWGGRRVADYSYPQDIQKIIDIFSPDSKKVQVIENVGDYEATVTAEGISVGCQKISLEKFDEIAAAVAKVREK